ncbi:cilia- and flagella-associated protein 43 isoform X2 [Elephas maximus indicus]|uniref:cilia- and flagella-associated protein 43 isoform X2 n=1 Tax=Elephas maximus indicus TaxID=99487 RepID=UPI002115EC6C|nr:cilia- and flagella-associated protein 43 isoform X2 [Elephas maximus indicus]
MVQGREREDSHQVSGSPSLFVRWVQGFPKQNVQFVNNETICYPSGNYIIFINIKTKEKTVLQCVSGIVGIVATNIPCEVVAFSDRRLKPLIYIYNFPGMTRRTKLKGNILLDYTLLTFSHCGTYLASYSTLPEYELALWNWESHVILCKKSQPGVDVSQMTFNPMNWHQLCLSSSNAVTVWNIERSNQEHYLKPKSVKLPAEDGSIVDETDIIFTHSLLKDPIYGPVLPLSAIAGLVGEEAETFRPKDDLCPLLHPTMHCWTPSSDLYVGCEEGHLLMINGDTLKVTVLNKTEEPPPLDRRNIITPITLAYQKEGVLASGIDGFVYSFLIKDSSYKVQDFTEVEEPVEHLTFSPNYKMLLIQTEKGSTYIYTFGEEPTLDKILASCDGNFQAIDFITPGNSHFMTLTGSGDVGIWLLDDGSPVSRISLNTLSTVLACCPSSPSAAVGTVGGSVHFLDVADVNSPREVHKAFLSKASVQDVIYDQRGMYLLAGTSEGYIFVINAKPSSSFQILGYTEVGKGVLQISTVSLLETDIVEVMVLTPLPKTDRSRLEIFTLPLILPQVAAAFADERGKLRDEFIHRYLYEIEHALSSAVLDFQSQRIFGFCSHVPYICSYLLPKKEHTGICILKPFQKVQSKHYGYGKLYLSSHGLWLLTAAKGGILYIRDAYTLEMFARCRSHSYQAQGIRSLKASMDGQDILVNGRNDGTLVCLKWKRFGGVLATESLDHCLKLLTSLNTTMNEESAYIRRMRRDSLDLGSDNEKTASGIKLLNIDSSQEELVSAQDMKEISWMEAKGQEAIKKEVNQFSKKRREIKKGIKALAKTVQSMMEENETVGHIAKLEQQELSLDLEELERLHDESEEEVAKIRKDAEMDNLAKRYLAELIKEECWNSMAVKGRALKCFHIPCTVENFPMKERTAEEMKELEKVLQQKKIETECLKLRKEIVEAQSAASLANNHHEEDDEEEEEENVTTKDTNLPNYLLGSLSTDFGVDTSFLSSQLELHSREEKINQIILLKDIIYKVKTVFNNEFNAAYKQKEFEIARVKERNVRIQEIILDLELEETVWQPEFEDCEKPERTLVVEDSEITVSKHVKPWKKAKDELITAHRIEKWITFQSSDMRHRALMDMMGGVLEVKKEDILRMVIPQPAFMAKPDAVWSEEERKQFKEYEKKVKELNEEKDKYRKSLEAELKKLQNSIQESTQAFDEHLKRLFERRVKAEMVVNQEELKIANLIFSLLLDEELNSRELCLNNYLARNQEQKIQTSEAVRNAKEDLDMYKEHYDNLLAEDKVLDRSFKKEFSEIPMHQVDLLYKLFKRRPRIQKQKTHQDTANIVPFGERPGSDKSNKDAFAQLMKAMDELDNISNMPEGLDVSVWEHFCMTRRMKVENEQKVKQKAAGLMEMVTFLRKRVEEDEKVQQNIEKVFRELILLQEEKVEFQLNLTIQILLKQGQVELENFQLILEYSDAILINKNIIEDLNSVIRAQGQKKVTSMVESKDVHKGIFQIEWEHKKMEMEMEDLNQKAWDIQMLFFSRDRQKFLNEPQYETLIGIQIGVMEQTIAVLDKTHKKNVENCKKLLKKLGRFSNHKDVANYTLSCNLREELVAVSERRDICNAIGSKLTCEKIAKERYENMMQQQKLTNISKQQAEQISILQAEVERLRMRTFPALVPM